MKHYTVMLKPASSLCNLRCKYCFYCDVAEQREIRSFGKMTDLTRERILNRLAESLEPGDQLELAFQGGEPMLAGLTFYRALVQTVSQWDSRIHVSYAIQTNATLLDEAWCEFLKENRFLVGVSYDLLPEQHDAVRVDAAGRGTSRAVERAIALLREHAVEYNILCTLTNAVARHPQQVWKRIVQMDLRYVQFTPCLGELECPGQSVYALSPKRFASFYQTLFQLWLAEYRAGRYRSVKFIDDVVNLMAFGTPNACGLDGVCRPQIVVESDGSVYPCDFYCTDDNVLGNLCEQTVPELLASPKARAFVEREHRQPELCKTCGFRRFCGGGCKRMQREVCCAADDSFCGYGCFLRENAPVLEQIALAERRARGLG